MFLMVFMFMVAMMRMSLRSHHSFRLFFCDDLPHLCFDSFSFIMITVICQRACHEVQSNIGNAFDLSDLAFQLCRTVCTVDSNNFKLICRSFLFFMILLMVMMLMTSGGNDCIRFFFCDDFAHLCFDSFSFIMITIICQRACHEVQSNVGNAFDLSNLPLQLCCTICAVDTCDSKSVCCIFTMIFITVHNGLCLLHLNNCSNVIYTIPAFSSSIVYRNYLASVQ